MFDDEGLFGVLQSRKNHDDAQAVRPVAHQGQGEQRVGDALCRLSLELQHQQKKKRYFTSISTHIVKYCSSDGVSFVPPSGHYRVFSTTHPTEDESVFTI